MRKVWTQEARLSPSDRAISSNLAKFEIRPGAPNAGGVGNFRQITGYISKTVQFLLKSNSLSNGDIVDDPNCPKLPHFLHFAPPFIAS